MRKADVVAKAREYLGSPYQNQGRVKGKSIDCVGLALCVAEELGIHDRAGDPILRTHHSDYSGAPIGEDLLRVCRDRLIEKPFPIAPGDVLVISANPRNAGKDATHLGIACFIGNLPAVIHSYAGGRQRVVEHVLDARWMRRIRGVFSFPGVEG